MQFILFSYSIPLHFNFCDFFGIDSPFANFLSGTDTLGTGYEGDSHTIVFSKSYLTEQIRAGSGKLYDSFEDIPSNKYDSCYLITDRPNQTAKFILCLAYGIQIVSYTWIFECCVVSGIDVKDTGFT
jgi:hypothetical protein